METSSSTTGRISTDETDSSAVELVRNVESAYSKLASITRSTSSSAMCAVADGDEDGKLIERYAKQL